MKIKAIKTVSKVTNSFIFKVFAAILAITAVVVADNTPAPSYRPVAFTRYSEPSNDVPPNYNFQWLVQDDYANLNYGQNEERNDYATSCLLYTSPSPRDRG